MTLSTADCEAIRQRCEHAPKGPWGWTYDGSGDYSIGAAADPQAERHAHVYRRDPDAGAALCEFIAHAREDIPRLLAALEGAEQQLAEAARICEDARPDCCLEDCESMPAPAWRTLTRILTRKAQRIRELTIEATPEDPRG